MTNPNPVDQWIASQGTLALRKPMSEHAEIVIIIAGTSRLRWLLENKSDSPEPFTETRISRTREVTIPAALWASLAADLAAKPPAAPIRLAILHGGLVFVHEAPDIRTVTPDRRYGGKRGKSDLAWYRWSSFRQWISEPKKDSEPQPSILDYFS